MNGSDSGDTLPRWQVAHWFYINQQIRKHPARRAALETLLENDVRACTAETFADLVADVRVNTTDVIVDNYDQSNINEFIGYHATAGLVIRLPKINSPSDHLIVPVPALFDYLEREDLDAAVPETTLEGEAACLAYYSARHADTADDTNPSAITKLPLEATAYAKAQQYADIVEPEVTVHVGSLTGVREQTDALDAHLEFDVDVPEPDEEDTGWPGSEGKYNYAIVAEIRDVEAIRNHDELERILNVWQAGLLAAAQEGYYAETAKSTDAATVQDADLETRKTAVREQVPLNGTVNRLDFDMALTDSDRTIVSGCYALDDMSTQELQIND